MENKYQRKKELKQDQLEKVNGGQEIEVKIKTLEGDNDDFQVKLDD